MLGTTKGSKSEYDADESAVAFVDDALQRLLQLALRLLGHLLDLVVKAFSGDIIQRLSENVGLPDLAYVALKLLQQEVYDVF